MNPIMLVVIATAALVAAGILLWKNWDKIKEVFGGIGDAITGVFDSALEGAKGFFSWIGDKL